MLKLFSFPLRRFLRKHPDADIVVNCDGYRIQRRDHEAERRRMERIQELKDSFKPKPH